MEFENKNMVLIIRIVLTKNAPVRVECTMGKPSLKFELYFRCLADIEQRLKRKTFTFLGTLAQISLVKHGPEDPCSSQSLAYGN